MMTATIYNLQTGQTQTIGHLQASEMVRMNPRLWSFTPPAPADWEFQRPRYELTINLKPPARDRMRHDPPWSSMVESGVNPSDPDRVETWQYAEREYSKGEQISSTAWPHISMRPLNYSAERVLEFFKKGMKSKMTLSPWHDGRVRLHDGMTFGPAQIERPQKPERPTAA